MFGTLGLPELIVIGFILCLLFGAKKVPQLMKGVGQGIHELKKGVLGGGEKEETDGK